MEGTDVQGEPSSRKNGAAGGDFKTAMNGFLMDALPSKHTDVRDFAKAV